MELITEENSIIPAFYLPPTGGPLYWRNETSGVLVSAVWAYLHQAANDRQLKLLVEYLEYYIHTPCWDIPDNAFADELEDLRQSSKMIRTANEIEEWLFKALDIGIDPL